MDKVARDQVLRDYEEIIGEKLKWTLYGPLSFKSQHCSNCENKVWTAGDVLDSIFLKEYKCHACQMKGGFHSAALMGEKVHADRDMRYRVLDHTRLRAMKWYHATQVPRWTQHYNKRFTTLHAGSRLTAFNRMADEGIEKFKLYELQIRDDAKFTHRIPDSECYWDEMNPKRISSYINDYELPGSTSIIAHTEALEIVGCESFTLAALGRKIRKVRKQEFELYN